MLSDGSFTLSHRLLDTTCMSKNKSTFVFALLEGWWYWHLHKCNQHWQLLALMSVLSLAPF